jgi:hypothetical protein
MNGIVRDAAAQEDDMSEFDVMDLNGLRLVFAQRTKEGHGTV